METENITSAKSNEKLQYGLSAQEVVNFIKTLDITPSDNLSAVHFSTMNVSVAQIAVRPYNSLPDYIREMDMLAKQAANSRSHILCLPEFAGFLPVSLFPQYDRIMNELRINPQTNFPEDMWIYQAFVGACSESFEVYFTTMSALASAYGIYIASGSTIYKESGEFVHRALLFGPTGKLEGYQDKFLPREIERSLQIEPATRLKVFDTHVGKIAMIIDDDIKYFELSKVAYNLGARVIINPSAFISPYKSTMAADGLNLRVQENPFYGIQPTLIGDTPIGFILEGVSGIYAPSKFSPSTSKNCKFVSSIKKDQTQVISQQLDLESLEGLEYSSNPEFISANIDYIY